MSTSHNPSRRSEDADPHVVLVQSDTDKDIKYFRVILGARNVVEPAAETVPDPLHDVALMIELGGGRSLSVPVSEGHMFEGGSEQDRMLRAAREYVRWRRERNRAGRRLQLPDRLLAFTEDLSRSSTVQDVYDVAMQHVPRVVEGFACLLFVASGDGDSPDSLVPVQHPVISVGVHDISLPAHVRYSGPELIEAESVLADHGPFSRLQALFHECELVKAAFVPLGDAGGFVLGERRAVREFTAEDWHLLRSLARQIELALDRIRLFERIRVLSLTDPLTGIGNRRRLDVVMEHSLGAARRGEPLTAVLLDLDGFKMVNDREGHLRGDQILRLVARTLQEQLRGSDVVVRYGGDEFLMLLQGSADGAEVLLHRVRAQLTGVISFSVGVAEFDDNITSAEQLVHKADRALYRTKHQQRLSATA
jgi:diguanylate cyclase (GGDEF)-like protein